MADLNIWLALSFGSHPHSSSAWAWYRNIQDGEVAFCRLTQIGLLRLLTTEAVMGKDCRTMRQAWAIYDGWLADPTVRYVEDPADVTSRFRTIGTSVASSAAPKTVADHYLLALSESAGATLVTFDGALAKLASKVGPDVVRLV